MGGWGEKGANLVSSDCSRKLSEWLEAGLSKGQPLFPEILNNSQTSSYRIWAVMSSFQSTGSCCRCCYRYRGNTGGHSLKICCCRKGKALTHRVWAMRTTSLHTTQCSVWNDGRGSSSEQGLTSLWLFHHRVSSLAPQVTRQFSRLQLLFETYS